MLDAKAVALIGSMKECQWGRLCQNFARMLVTCLGQALRGVSARQACALLLARDYDICIGLTGFAELCSRHHRAHLVAAAMPVLAGTLPSANQPRQPSGEMSESIPCTRRSGCVSE
jgi:hypothetical protein